MGLVGRNVEALEKWSQAINMIAGILVALSTIGGAAAFLWAQWKNTRKADLHVLVPAAAELAQDFFGLYKAARKGETYTEKVRIFQEKFIQLARDRGYEPTPAEIAHATTMGSAYHKAAKRAVTAPEPEPAAVAGLAVVPAEPEKLDPLYAGSPGAVTPNGGAEGKA